MRHLMIAAAFAAASAATPALAQRAAKTATQVTVTNARTVALASLEIATTGEQSRLVAKLAKPLAPGKSITLKLNKPVGCTYYVLAKFGDDVETDAESMDFCADKVLRLTE